MNAMNMTVHTIGFRLSSSSNKTKACIVVLLNHWLLVTFCPEIVVKCIVLWVLVQYQMKT